MNKTSALSLVIAIAALISVFVFQKQGGTAETKNETVHERVLRTGTIRCGYALWPPFITKDPNTGVISGVEVDYLDALGKALELKVAWTEEVGYGSFIEALTADRIDAMCGVWPMAVRSRQVDFTNPIGYTPAIAFIRVDDTRFDGDLYKLNDPAYTIATIDGEMSSIIAQNDFPRAKTLSLPQLSDMSMMLSNVAEGKADVTFGELTVAMAFMEQNPGKLKLLHPESPLRIGANTLAVKKGQQDFLGMLNTTTDELIWSGVIERILRKYEKYPGSFYRVSDPYMIKTK